jgi:nitrate reductase molybdenum cofactor assembly chaperone NarJ/NarW
MMGGAAALAEFYRYPSPGFLGVLKERLLQISDERARKACMEFLNEVQKMTLGEWEELYTRTLDINPPSAPYIGFQIWREGYQRGTFLSQMNRALYMEGISSEGELPDHLLPVLRYLDSSQHPLPELMDALPPAIKRMQATLRKADPANPYNFLLEAVAQLVDRLVTSSGLISGIHSGGSR